MSQALAEIEYVSVERAIPMRRVWAMPNACTFDIPPIRALVKSYLHKSRVSVDPFARNKRWATYTNDLNPDTAAEKHLDAVEFLRGLASAGVRADLVLFDPPYSVRQIAEVYQQVGRGKATFEDYSSFGRWQEEKDLCARLLSDGGAFLHFGWTTYGLGSERGAVIEQVLLVAHGSCRNDTICTVERKVENAQSALFDESAHNEMSLGITI